MQSTNHQRHPHLWAPSKIRLLEIGLFVLAIALATMVALPASSRTVNFGALFRNLVPNIQRTAPVPVTGNSANPAERADTAAFEQNMRRLAAIGSPAAYQELIQALKQSEPMSHRDITIVLLKDASPEIVPVLLNSLNDPDEGVRAGAAQVLGLRHEYQAMAGLAAATHDPSPQVRREAVKSLGEIDAWQVLPRLEQLQVNESDADVRKAADSAVATIKNEIASEIGVPNFQIAALSVTTSDPPRPYAVTESALYARQGATWERVSQLPDTPLALATGSDEDLLYLSTVSAGLYRSSDGGMTWQYIQFGVDTPTHITITAIAVDPQNSQQLYAALAAPGAALGKLDALGVFASAAGSDAWLWLKDSPMQAITTHLILDPESPGYLFGRADDMLWRYDLRNNVPKSPSN